MHFRNKIDYDVEKNGKFNIIPNIDLSPNINSV